jgi:probable phosphoglycerate mutase
MFKKLFLICLIGAQMFGIRNIANSDNNAAMTLNELIDAWQNFFNKSNWQELIKEYSPIQGNCGVVYELPNFLNRSNEGLAVVDMSQLDFAEPHYHPDLEVYFVLQGEALVVVGNEKYSVKKGDVVVIPPFKAHYTIPNDEFVIACINTPPYTPESYIPLKKSDTAVEFDCKQFEKDTDFFIKSLSTSEEFEKSNHIPHIPFYFARHGETDWNKANKVMGQIDIPLNKVGLEQAQVISEKMVHLDISHIFSSPLKRATQTAEIIAKATNTPITVIEELKNAFAGIMEGQDRGNGKWLEDWRMGSDIEGAESWSEFTSRVSIGLKKALAQAIDKKPILIVGHGPTYWALLPILNVPAADKKAENCVVYFFSPPDLGSNQWKVSALGEKKI